MCSSDLGYRAPVPVRTPRSRAAVTALLLVGTLPACGLLGGGGASGCGIVRDLDGIATDFSRTDLADPVAFDRALGSATDRYVTTARRLRSRLPSELRDDLDRHIAAVRRYRFADAAADRRAIDAWAADACGRRSPTTTEAP